MAGSLFISHANADAKIAAELCQALEARGFGCWLASRDVAPGENFQVAIVRAIRQARILLLVFTSAANSSDEVAKELALASQAKAPVVPLKVEDVQPSEALAYEFATRQWIDFHTDWTRAIEQLCRHVSSVLTAEGEDAPAAPEPPAVPAALGPPATPPATAPVTPPGAGAPTVVRRRNASRADSPREPPRGAEAWAGWARERDRAGRRRRERSGPAGLIRLLILLVIALAIAATVVLPRLKAFLSPAAPVNATAPAAPAAPARPPANATSSDVPF